MSGKVRTLLRRPDFIRNPIRAIFRRVWWRVRWLLTKKPWLLTLTNGLQIAAPKGGSGALIYYQGNAEPEVAAFLTKTLKPGMTFWDIGSHIGEYALLASPLVGTLGQVEAFEPQPAMFEFLRANVARNQLANVAVHDVAIAHRTGRFQMSLPSEPAIAHLSLTREETELPTVMVMAAPLTEVLDITAKRPNVIKVDVEGAERHVLQGAQTLLDLPTEEAPLWVMEYEPENCEAFGYAAHDLLTEFRAHGLFTYWLNPKGECDLILDPAPPTGVRTVIATKGARP